MPGANSGSGGQDNRLSQGSLDRAVHGKISLTPLQAELIEDGIEPDPDMMHEFLALVRGATGPALTDQPVKDANLSESDRVTNI